MKMTKEDFVKFINGISDSSKEVSFIQMVILAWGADKESFTWLDAKKELPHFCKSSTTLMYLGDMVKKGYLTSGRWTNYTVTMSGRVVIGLILGKFTREMIYS